jgi:hypothetical protein
MTTTSASPTTSLRASAFAVGGAVLATALLWTLARILGVELRVEGNGQPAQVISLPFACTVTLAVALLAWGARALLDRLTRRAAAVWTVLAALVLLVSFVPLSYVDADGAAKVILALMHLAVAAVLISAFARARRAEMA